MKKMQNIETAEYAEEFEFKLLHNTNCITWKWRNSYSDDKKEADRERNRRKTIKNRMGNLHVDTSMLDSKTVNHGMEYCDINFYTERSSLWY
jgi:hypothetical protein